MILIYKFSFFYLLTFSVVAFDNGNRFKVSEWLSFLNIEVAYFLLLYMVVVSLVFFCFQLARGECDRLTALFLGTGCVYVFYSLIYNYHFSYLSYNQIGFCFVAASLLFKLDVSKFKPFLIASYGVLLFFSIAMSLVKYYELDLPIVRYSDLILKSTDIRASSGLFLQTNASGAFFCLSALIFLSLYDYTKSKAYLLCCFFSIIALIVGKSLGPIAIFLFLSLFYANSLVLVPLFLGGLFLFVFKWSYFTYYLEYKFSSGSTKFDVFIYSLERFSANVGDFIFGQFYSGNVNSLIYTESSMLDIINNYGLVGFLWCISILGALISIRKYSPYRKKNLLVLPVVAMFLLSLTQNSTLMLSHLYIVILYLSIINSVKVAELCTKNIKVFNERLS